MMAPNDPYTYQLLEVLDRFQVHATFFMIGDYVRQQPEVARAVRKAGHAVGSHSMSHPRLMYASKQRIREEIHSANALIEDILGERIQLFRPPFGGRSPAVLRIARELHLNPIMWNVTGFDWNAKSARAIELHIERGIVHNQNRQIGTNVLLHDGGHTRMGCDRRRTISATATLLNMMPRTGMHLVTVDHWLPHEHEGSDIHEAADKTAPGKTGSAHEASLSNPFWTDFCAPSRAKHGILKGLATSLSLR